MNNSLMSFRATVHKASGVAIDGWKMLNEADAHVR
jgi:hypothetical protein